MDQIEGLREPPHSREAEQAVLGSMLLNNESYERVHWLQAKDFYSQQHRLIFGAMLKLIASGKPADVITTAEELKAEKQAEEAGGLAYLHSLAQGVASTANIHRYAEIMKVKSVSRELAAAAVVAGDLAYDNSLPVSEKIDRVQQMLMAVQYENVKDPQPAAQTVPAHREVMRKRHQREIVGVPTGFVDLDARLHGLQGGDLIIVAGRPGMGKSSLAFQIAEQAAMKGNAALCLSMEMSRLQCTDRAIARLSGFALDSILTGDAYGRAGLEEAYDLYGSLPLFLDDQPALTVTQAKAKARALKRRHNLKLVVVDYIQLMRARGQDRNNEISNITQGLKSLAKELDLPVIALSQLNRKCEERQDKRPMMSDLRDSGAIEADADVVLFIYRHEQYYPDDLEWRGIAEVIIGKHRQGSVGHVPLTFLGQNTAFKNFGGTMPERNRRTSSREHAGIDE